MALEIIPVGGYKEVGRNCVFIKVDDEIVILDMGLNIEKYIKYTESEDSDEFNINPETLIRHQAIPNINKFRHLLPKVKALCVSHPHLDHLGAIPYITQSIRFPVHGTPFAIEVLKDLIYDKNRSARIKLVSHKPNAMFKIGDSITGEFVHTTHSTPHTAMIALHTKYGIIVYANDFKFDNNPVLGTKPNLKRLAEFAGNVKLLIINSLYVHYDMKMPSEIIARELLKDVLLGVDSKGKNIVITTFSSHIARLKSIVEIGRTLNRKIVFLGRSLAKYVCAAEKTGLIDFRDDVEIVKYGDKVKSKLSSIRNTEDYIFVVTGNQGEPNSVLSRMLNEHLFNFRPGDHVIFSSRTIPVPVTIENRRVMEEELKKRKVRIFKDINVS
ncbi:MAG: MBL fold metallo-hydrolase [Candidatus Woesearchaeota archaeon]